MKKFWNKSETSNDIYIYGDITSRMGRYRRDGEKFCRRPKQFRRSAGDVAFEFRWRRRISSLSDLQFNSQLQRRRDGHDRRISGVGGESDSNGRQSDKNGVECVDDDSSAERRAHGLL